MRAFLAAVMLSLFVTSPALAQKQPTTAILARSFPAPPIEARSAVLLDAQTGKVLTSKNAHLRVQIASTTKVMTAVLALQLGHLTDRIKVPASAFNFESDATVMGLRAGETVTLKDLLYGLLLPSGADAANVIAIHYGGSETKFAALMNQKAADLGMNDTHYVTAHGLDTPGQYSSAYDLALLGVYASKIPQLMAIAGTRSYNWAGHTLVNVNHVLFWYPGVDGIKPGYTYAAGICQLLDAHRGGRHVIAAILDTPDLVIDARNLLNFGLQDYTWIKSPLTYDVPGLTVNGTGSAGPYAYYIGSGHYVRGGFLKQYWNFSRGLPLGFPRTEALQVNGHLVQYFQNGELEQKGGKVIRVPLGAMPLPTPSPTPSPTTTAHAGPTSTPISVQKEGNRGTPTPTPVPPVPTPTTRPRPSVASPLAAYVKAHGALGSPSLAPWKVKGYTLQTFQYGALAYDPGAKRVWMLPLGDRMLAALRYLPQHPGNGYPPDFAPATVLHAIGWVAG